MSHRACECNLCRTRKHFYESHLPFRDIYPKSEKRRSQMRNSFKNPQRVIGCFALVVPGRSLLFTFAPGCLLVCCRLLCGSEPVDFQRDVGPILQQRCLSCHNDRDHRGGLSLQSAEMAGRGGESGVQDHVPPPVGDEPMPREGRALAAQHSARTLTRQTSEALAAQYRMHCERRTALMNGAYYAPRMQ